MALGRGIPALPKRMVEKMLAWEHTDLADLPPARANVAKDALGPTSRPIDTVHRDSMPSP